MKILSIETSCDETAVSLLEAKGGLTEPYFSVLANALFSQIDIHREYGGVFPNVAKREHAKNLPFLLKKVLEDGNQYQKESEEEYSEETWEKIKKITEKDDKLFDGLKESLSNIKKPEIDIITVTSGPGLEPALWVGISCAKALGELWGIPVIPSNHMEGHITSVLLNENNNSKVEFPALALLISGGHTELVEIEKWGKYKIIGETKDDAVGEAFDKVARMLGLPYPGGPEISRLAKEARDQNLPQKCKLPRPMINSGDLNFSFSGIKTAVLYYIRDNPIENEGDKMDIAREFEDSVIDVMLSKTQKAIEKTGAKTLIVAGGVISNRLLREKFKALENSELMVKIPENSHSTDNALMIASAAYMRYLIDPEIIKTKHNIVASGNLKLS